MDRAFFLKKFPTMRKHTPVNYRKPKPSNGSASEEYDWHEDLKLRFPGSHSKQDLFYLAAVDDVEKDPVYIDLCKSHDEDHHHVGYLGPNPQVLTPHLAIPQSYCDLCSAKKGEMRGVVFAEYEVGKR
jgi:hypothetical protein